MRLRQPPPAPWLCTVFGLALFAGCDFSSLLPPEPFCDTREVWFPDADGDGMGEDTAIYIGCFPPPDWVTTLAPKDTAIPPDTDTPQDTDIPVDSDSGIDTATGDDSADSGGLTDTDANNTGDTDTLVDTDTSVDTDSDSS